MTNEQLRERLHNVARWLENGCEAKHAANEIRLIAHEIQQPSAQQSEPTFRVQCRCGWQGTTDQLLVAATPVGKRCCPKCHATFERYPVNQGETPHADQWTPEQIEEIKARPPSPDPVKRRV